jgi:hypothetical protein
MPAVNYTPHVNGAGNALNAAELNAPIDELSRALEKIKDGSKAMSAPDIASFINGLHDHADAAGGGQIEGNDIASTGASNGQVLTPLGWITPAILPTFFRRGLEVQKLSDSTILVSTGEVVVNGTLVQKATQTVLDLATAADWIGGATHESASQWMHVYMTAAGALKLHDWCPYQSLPSAFVCEARIAQATWTGGVGLGYNATSVIIDNGSGGDPANEANIQPGMLLGVYSDSGYTLGRGKGASAAAAETTLSFARITAVNTATNTLTLEADHRIAMNDNDYLTVIPDGAVIYRQESATWYRWLGAIFNNASSDLDAAHIGHRHRYNFQEGSDTSTASTTMVAASSGGTVSLLSQGGDIEVSAHGLVSINNVNARVHFETSVDGATPTPTADEGFLRAYNPNAATHTIAVIIDFTRLFVGLLPGTHEFQLKMRVSAGTGTFYGTYGCQLFAREMGNNGVGY